MSEQDAKQPGVTRDRLVGAALDVIQEDGLGALSMRALADRLGVKAASLYWHIRDREELVGMIAQSLLTEVRPRSAGRAGWRAEALAVCAALEAVMTRHRDAARVVLEVPEALERSDAHARLRSLLEGAGLPAAEAYETATMMLAHVLVAATRSSEADSVEPAKGPARLAIDTGSRGVTVRAGSSMEALVRVAHDPLAPAPAIVRGDSVIVRRRRGVGVGELELNPARPWRFKVQAPTWNTTLDLAGLDVREVYIDSGATRIDCALPPPRGVVLLHVSSGVVGVKFRRAPGVPVVAEISTGALQLKLDAFSIGATTSDVHWESVEGAAQRDHYVLRISSGAIRVSLTEDASVSADLAGAGPATTTRAGVTAALNVVLDGVEHRVSS